MKICEISHQKFAPSYRKYPMRLMIFMNTDETHLMSSPSAVKHTPCCKFKSPTDLFAAILSWRCCIICNTVLCHYVSPRWAEVRSGAWRCAPPSTSYMQNAPLCTPAHLQSYPDSGVQGGAHLPAPPGLSHLLIAFISNCMAEVLLGCAPPSTSRT